MQLIENERHAAARLVGGGLAMLVQTGLLLLLLGVEVRLVGLRHILFERALAGLFVATMKRREKEFKSTDRR